MVVFPHQLMISSLLTKYYKMGHFRPPWVLYWLLVPLLAVAAYAPVLSMWFVSDDFGHLHYHERLPGLSPFSTFSGGVMFYRPLSTVLIWNVGYPLFGLNALPYHVISLALHALTAWLLARAVGTISGEALTGWVAGALFAVYPLSAEPVAWLASQWDLWAGACAAGAVWGFASFWRTGKLGPYAIGLALAFVGVMMKESILPLPALLPFVALAIDMGRKAGVDSDATSGKVGRGPWLARARRAVLWSLPFFVPSVLFAGLRVATGGIGGYSAAATDWQHFFWDALVAAAGQMLMPLNRSVFNQTFVQIAGLLVTVGFLLGLVVYGRRIKALLMLSLAWWLVFLIPALNLVKIDNPEAAATRIFYLSLMGFCIALAALLTKAIEAARSWQATRVALVGVILCILPVSWLQLDPWVRSSRQAEHIVAEMGRLVEPLPRRWVQFNVRDLPLDFKGSYVFLNGFDEAMDLFNNQISKVERASELDPARLAEPFAGVAGMYNLAFAFNAKDQLYHVSELSGVTNPIDGSPQGSKVWDFRGCAPEVIGKWQVAQAQPVCEPDQGLTLRQSTSDARMVVTGLSLGAMSKEEQWVRLRVSVQYPLAPQPEPFISQWYWKGAGEELSEERHRNMVTKQDGQPYVYWMFIPAKDVGSGIEALRFDPVNGKVDATVQWIAIDIVE